jgi:hypothetical protein
LFCGEIIVGVAAVQEDSMFFFEKKNQKTRAGNAADLSGQTRDSIAKSVVLPFFPKKKACLR